MFAAGSVFVKSGLLSVRILYQKKDFYRQEMDAMPPSLLCYFLGTRGKDILRKANSYLWFA
jgi:hypothetical protein